MTEFDEATRAHFGPIGPVIVAQTWLEAVLEDGDLRRAWALTHLDLRRKLAAAWVAANTEHPLLRGRDLEDLEDELVNMVSMEPLWAAFEQVQIGEFRNAWSHLDLERRGWASHPRPEAVSRELVLLVDPDHPSIQRDEHGHMSVRGTEGEDVEVRAFGLIMEYVDEAPEAIAFPTGPGEAIANQWRVADFYEPGDQLPPHQED